MKALFRTTPKLIMFAIIATIALTSCEGPEGPIGPRGTTGAQGPQGARGEKGANGEDGNSNVKSYRFSVESWNLDPDYLFSHYVNPAIDLDIVENGYVQVYYKIAEPNSWVPVPETFLFDDFFYSITYVLGEGLISLQLISKEQPIRRDLFLGDYRLIIVSGSAGDRITEEVDFSDYNAVAEYFQLEK